MIGRIAAFALGTLAVIALAWLWLGVPASTEAGKRLGRERAERLSTPRDDVLPFPAEFFETALSAGAAIPHAGASDPHRLAIRDPALTSTRMLHASATLLDADGAPLAGAYLEALDADEAPLTRATAAASGRVSLRVEVPDAFQGETHHLRFEFGAPGHAVTRGKLQTFFSGSEHDFGEVRLPRAQRLSGRLVDDRGVAVPHAEVWLDHHFAPRPTPAGLTGYDAARRRAVTDEQGRFLFSAQHRAAGARVAVASERGKLRHLTNYARDVQSPEHDVGDVVWTPPRERRALLRLRAVDAEGRPLAAARAGVHVLDDEARELSEPIAWLRSAGRGAIADAEGWITVREPEITSMGPSQGVAIAARGHVVRMLPLAEVRDAEVVLARAEPLRVALRDAESGAPLTGVDVAMETATGSRDRGRAWIELEPGDGPGEWIVRDAVARDLRLAVWAEGFGRRRVALEASLPRGITHTVDLTGPRTVTFRVLDPQGNTLTDLRAQFSGPRGSSSRHVSAEPRPDGSLVARGLEPGEHQLTLWTDAAPRTTLTVNVGDEPVTDLGDLELVTYGRVLLEVLDADGAPAEHEPLARLVLDDDTEFARTRGHDDGRLLYYDMLPGRWTFELEPGGRVEVDVQSSTTHEATLRLTPWARIEGRVLRDGVPLAGARVLAFKEPPPEQYHSAVEMLQWWSARQWNLPEDHDPVVTDDRGMFAFELPAHADTQLLAIDPLSNRSAPVLVDSAAGELRIADLRIARGSAVLEGLVLHPETGAPAPGGIVQVDGVRVGEAGPDGRFRITGLPERAVILHSYIPGFPTIWLDEDDEPVRLKAGEATHVELTAAPEFRGTICSF